MTIKKSDWWHLFWFVTVLTVSSNHLLIIMNIYQKFAHLFLLILFCLLGFNWGDE